MKTVFCASCGHKMKKNGTTSAGRQRWRCPKCGASQTIRYDPTASRLDEFLGWLLSKDTQLDMPGQGRTFRRRTSAFWHVWPMPPQTGELHRVIYVDGIYLARNLVVLIASSKDYVLGWYMAESETARAWECLLAPIPAPSVVVSDGGSGFAKAVRRVWPETRVQRCVFHAFSQVKRYTTSRPRLQAGIELYGLAKDLMHLDALWQAELWVERFFQWCDFWNDFLEERSWQDGRFEYTHIRLRKASASLGRLVRQGTLVTYLDPELTLEGPLPRTNNRIEGGVNAQLRAVLRNHRGLSKMRRAKAVYWWCYMHTEEPLQAKDILAQMPTDEDIDFLYRTYSARPKREDGGPEWGDRAVWEELHHKDSFRFWLD